MKPTRHTTIIALQDIDAAGVVFHGRLLDIAHRAVEAAFAEADLALPALLAEGRWRLPLVRLEADYLASVRHGEAVVAQVASLGRSRRAVRLQTTLVVAARTVARVLQVHACVAVEGGVAVPWPAELAAKLDRLMGDPACDLALPCPPDPTD